MKKAKYHKIIFGATSLSLLFVLLYWALDFPINVDEFLHGKQAKMVVDWYASGGTDDSCLHDRPDNLRYYGQSIDNFAASINHVFNIEQEYITRHIIGALCAWVLLIFTGLLTYNMTQNYLVAALAMIALFISPRPFGQAINNLKDIPYALGYIWATLGTVKFIREMPKPGIKTTLLLASGIAFTISVRIGGLLSFFILGFFILVWIVINRKQIPLRHIVSSNKKHYCLVLLFLILIGYFGGLLFWPYGLQNPIINPIKSLSLMSHYAISIRQIFEGDYYWSTHLPWYYAPKWLLISIPEFIWLALLLLLVVGSHKLKSKKRLQNFDLAIVIFCVLFPLVYVVAIKSNLYSGWRQLYFIYPLIIVLAAYGVFEFWNLYQNKIIRYSMMVLILVLSFFPIKHIVKTYPNHYIYFNEIADINNTCWSNYEYDYYFHGMKESSNWLFENIDVPQGATIASNLDLRPYFPKEKNLKYKYVHFYEYHKKEWDYAILTNNYVHPYQLKNNKWKPNGVLKTFYHNNNPYTVVMKWNGDDAIIGQHAFEKGLYHKAAKHFEIASENDRNNNHLKALLAMSYINEKRFEEAKTVIAENLAFNPYNEALYYLKAKVYFAEEEYVQALDEIQKLLKINSKYKMAYPLMANCYQKLGNFEMSEKLENH